jgi:hypothetical protein
MRASFHETRSTSTPGAAHAPTCAQHREINNQPDLGVRTQLHQTESLFLSLHHSLSPPCPVFVVRFVVRFPLCNPAALEQDLPLDTNIYAPARKGRILVPMCYALDRCHMLEGPLLDLSISQFPRPHCQNFPEICVFVCRRVRQPTHCAMEGTTHHTSTHLRMHTIMHFGIFAAQSSHYMRTQAQYSRTRRHLALQGDSTFVRRQQHSPRRALEKTAASRCLSRVPSGRFQAIRAATREPAPTAKRVSKGTPARAQKASCTYSTRVRTHTHKGIQTDTHLHANQSPPPARIHAPYPRARTHTHKHTPEPPPRSPKPGHPILPTPSPHPPPSRRLHDSHHPHSPEALQPQRRRPYSHQGRAPPRKHSDSALAPDTAARRWRKTRRWIRGSGGAGWRSIAADARASNVSRPHPCANRLLCTGRKKTQHMARIANPAKCAQLPIRDVSRCTDASARAMGEGSAPQGLFSAAPLREVYLLCRPAPPTPRPFSLLATSPIMRRYRLPDYLANLCLFRDCSTQRREGLPDDAADDSNRGRARLMRTQVHLEHEEQNRLEYARQQGIHAQCTMHTASVQSDGE